MSSSLLSGGHACLFSLHFLSLLEDHLVRRISIVSASFELGVFAVTLVLIYLPTPHHVREHTMALLAISPSQSGKRNSQSPSNA
jgi:hypothetical protein